MTQEGILKLSPAFISIDARLTSIEYVKSSCLSTQVLNNINSSNIINNLPSFISITHPFYTFSIVTSFSFYYSVMENQNY